MDMKYIITENRMKELYFAVLDKLFGEIEEFKNKNYPYSRWWRNNDGVVMELDSMGNELYVLSSIFRTFGNLFGIDNREQILEIIGDWVEHNLDIGGFGFIGTLGYEANGWGIYG